jgi:hypothetical protein
MLDKFPSKIVCSILISVPILPWSNQSKSVLKICYTVKHEDSEANAQSLWCFPEQYLEKSEQARFLNWNCCKVPTFQKKFDKNSDLNRSLKVPSNYWFRIFLSIFIHEIFEF